MTEEYNFTQEQLKDIIEHLNEFQQVAGLVCHDLDLIELMIDDDNLDVDTLKELIKNVIKMKNDIITNKKLRESRYNSIKMLLSLKIQDDTKE